MFHDIQRNDLQKIQFRPFIVRLESLILAADSSIGDLPVSIAESSEAVTVIGVGESQNRIGEGA